ncbi:MAG TPA: hypothetical protein VGJ58_04030 [Gaiellaceae bacterium]
MYPLSKTALFLIPRVVALSDRERMLQKFEAAAREARSTQIGANHVLETLLRTKGYRWLGAGLQRDTGHRDVVRDDEAEWEYALTAECRCPQYQFETPEQPGDA